MGRCHNLHVSGVCSNEPPVAKSKTPLKGTRPDAGPAPNMPVTIGHSVGLGGTNAAPDVVQVQRALNHVLPELAGASPFLKDDGLVGPVTLAAIKKFQDRNFSWSDSRVDPANKTIGLINHYLTTQPKPGDPHSHRDRVARALAQLKNCNQTILSAEQQLRAVLPHVQAGTTPSGIFAALFAQRMALLDRHFKLNQVEQKAVVIQALITRFTDMRAVITHSIPDKPNLDSLFSGFLGDEAFVLDTTDSDVNAYTFLGGWNKPGVIEQHSKRREDRIYLCDSMDNVSDPYFEQVLVHELAHFVSPDVPGIIDYGYGWINDPRMTRLATPQRLCNAQNYCTYAIECRYGQRENRLGV